MNVSFPSIPLYVWAIIFLISIIIVIGEGGYRVWSKERQSNAITPLEIQAIAFDPPHDLYGLCLKIANPASNSINMSGIRAIFADGKFEDFDLAGLELMPAKEMNGGSISLNPGDYALLTIFKAKSQIYFTSIAFPFKSQAGGLKAVSSKSEAYGELRIIVTVENAPAREVKVTWCETDGRFIAGTSQP